MQIPGDMVVNAMIMVMAANANKRSSNIKIYHIGSSLRNPIHFFKIHKLAFSYFSKNPYTDVKGKTVKISRCTVLDSSAKFHGYIAIKYLLPLKVGCSIFSNITYIIIINLH